MTEPELDLLIAEKHAQMGFTGDNVNDSPSELPQQQEAYDGMRFFIRVNEATDGESTTVHVVHGTWSRRENKRTLRTYLSALGYKKHSEQKQILKDLGLWSKKKLGTHP